MSHDVKASRSVHQLTLETRGQGLYEITKPVREAVAELLVHRPDDGPADGLCTLFVQHTSASLTIQENADPSARRDLEAWLARLVPEEDALYTHTLEGPDDMPAHIKAALTATSLGIPVVDGDLALGTWQGVFLWEHRTAPKRRSVVVHVA